jgi:long-chain acyl-CoA synthetase
LVVSGGAPLAPHLSEWFHAAGILVVEGYGLTETSAPATTNTPDDYRFGTVGKAIPGTDIRIAEDGEIEIRGPGVFSGYFKSSETTAAAFTADGFFRSGDIGELDADGFLRITDRKKNLIITAGGKNVGPGKIENLLKDHPLIGQAMVCGDRKPYLVCLLSLDPEDAPLWAQAEEIEETSLEALTHHPKILAAVADHVDRVNSELASYESLKYWDIVGIPFLPENGYLTPTLKLKRRAILADFGDRIENIYLQATSEALSPVERT